MASAAAFSVPGCSLGWWQHRLAALQVDADDPVTCRARFPGVERTSFAQWADTTLHAGTWLAGA